MSPTVRIPLWVYLDLAALREDWDASHPTGRRMCVSGGVMFLGRRGRWDTVAWVRQHPKEFLTGWRAGYLAVPDAKTTFIPYD